VKLAEANRGMGARRPAPARLLPWPAHLVSLLFSQDKREEAIAEYRYAIRLQPDFAPGAAPLPSGLALIDQGSGRRRSRPVREAFLLKPDSLSADIRAWLGS